MSIDIAKVIIPKFVDYDSDIKYFIPRFAKIQKGGSVQWTNLDNNPHRLSFYEILNGETHVIGTLGPIAPNASKMMQFPYDINRIDYFCDIHGNEIGSVVIFFQNEETMTNTERLRFLSRVFKIDHPDVYSHLRD